MSKKKVEFQTKISYAVNGPMIIASLTIITPGGATKAVPIGSIGGAVPLTAPALFEEFQTLMQRVVDAAVLGTAKETGIKVGEDSGWYEKPEHTN